MLIGVSSCLKATQAGEEFNNQEFDTYLRYMPKTDADGVPGDIEVTEADLEYSYNPKIFNKLPVKLSLNNQYIGINNSTAVELPAHLISLVTDIETTFPFFKINKTYIRVGLSPSFYGDDWNFGSSDFRMPVRSYIIYLPDNRWTFLLGVAVYPDFEKEVLPVLGFIYKPNDKLIINMVPQRPNISYLLNDRTTLFLEGGGSFNSEFEVDKDDRKDVVLRYKESHLGAGVTYRLNHSTLSSFAVGGVFNRSLKYNDSLGKVNIKDGLYAEIRLRISI